MAVLLELVEFVEAYSGKSVTSSACQWKKKVRQDTDVPVEVAVLPTRLPGALHSEVPIAYDPCPGLAPPSVDEFYSGLRKLRPNASILYNKFKFEKENCTPVQNAPSLLEKMKRSVEENPSIILEELVKSIVFSKDEIILIENITQGQANNPQWFAHRKGMITASKFYEATHMLATTKPDRFVKNILFGNDLGENLPAPLRYGIQNENCARKMFIKSHKKIHQLVTIDDQGLTISDSHVFLGASPDGLVTCKQCGKFLLEIKCAWSKRNFHAKSAARDHCYVDEYNILHLDPKSKWYAQIQGQLGICKFNLCKLVVYTNRGIHVVDVPFDETFWKVMEAKLVKFYMSHVGPATLALLNNS